MNTRLWIPFALLAGACTPDGDAPPPPFPAMPVVPSEAQVAYTRMEYIGFVHWGLNTWTDREWGYGDESPDLFDPTAFDANQWARVASDAGMGELILTAKHHDGFTLWPSAHTEHSVAASPWMNGEGDVVREFVDAARAHDVKVGLYLSPWDRNHADYGTPAYIDYYRAQLTELLSDYGDITELWVDGANGGDGYYGGAREERRIDRETYYDWPNTVALAKSLQPDLLIFSDAGPDIRWMGNERGFAGETNWSTLDRGSVVIGAADEAYLNSGDPEGPDWVVPLCNTSIRPGWFYHEDQDGDVKSPQVLMDLWYRSVGRNCVLLLNIPPDRRGLFHENDVAVLREFRRILDETFDEDLASGGSATATSVRGDHPDYAAARVLDGDPDTFWAPDDGVDLPTIEIEFGGPVEFDRILLAEPIRLGQRVSAFAVEARVDGMWTPIADATTIGAKRVLRLPRTSADAVRVRILGSRAVPALSSVELYRASADEGSADLGLPAGTP